mgnify:CR=1 FL=1
MPMKMPYPKEEMAMHKAKSMSELMGIEKKEVGMAEKMMKKPSKKSKPMPFKKK